MSARPHLHAVRVEQRPQDIDDDPPLLIRYTLPVAAAALVALLTFFGWLLSL